MATFGWIVLVLLGAGVVVAGVVGYKVFRAWQRAMRMI